MNDREWREYLDVLGEHTEHVVSVCAEIDLTEPSGLPGWTRAHVVAHLIGNARGLGRLTRWARDGIERPMYPSMEAREADIVQRVAWSDDELVLALGQSSLELQHELESLDDEGRARIVWRNTQLSFPGDRIPALRLQEVVIHHTDLGLGTYGHDQWPDELVQQMWRASVKEYSAREDAPVGFMNDVTLNDSTIGVRGDQSAILAWLIGRSDGADLDVIGSDALPTPPPWR